MNKWNLKQFAAAAVLLGIGGTIGTVAAGVLNYDAHAQAMAQLQYDSDHEAMAPVVRDDIATAVQTFTGLDSAAKDAFSKAKVKF